MLNAQIDIVKDFSEKTTRDVFAFMQRHDRSSTIRVPHKAVTSFLAGFLEAEFFKDFDKLSGFDRRELGQAATSISCRPTNSGIEISPFADSRQSSIASFMRESKVARSFACVWQPFIDGTDATKMPSSSFSITTVTLCFNMIFDLLNKSITQGIKKVKVFMGNSIATRRLDDIEIHHDRGHERKCHAGRGEAEV